MIKRLLSLLVFTHVLATAVPESHVIPSDYKCISCEIKPISTTSAGHSRPCISTRRKINPRFRRTNVKYASSNENWSGYVAQTSLEKPQLNSVTKVFGSWIVPDIKPIPSPELIYSAFWIGIDGYGNPTVEQIGTTHAVVKGVVFHWAWFEMFPLPSSMIVGFPVAPGDRISASVIYNGDGVFQMQMSNNTQKVFTQIPFEHTTLLTAQRACAEWIVEAPWLNGTLPLANFGTALLSECYVEINNIVGVINSSSWIHEEMKMVAPDGTLKAQASPLTDNGTAFSVTWKHQ